MAPHEHHSHAHLDEAAWAAHAEATEREGELHLAFVTDTAAWVDQLRGADASPVRTVLDIGCGPGVGACELATRFPDADVFAIDSSPGMLGRATQRIARHGLGDRVHTHVADLPRGLDSLAPADVIWASMSLHHMGDEVATLRVLREHLDHAGILALAEVADPIRFLPDALDLGAPGLGARLDEAERTWFASMRAGLADSVPSADLAQMVADAGFEVLGDRVVRLRHDPPLSAAARQVAHEHLVRVRDRLAPSLDDVDRAALDDLTDPDASRGVRHRPDVFVAASRRIVLARSR
jgi:SAM-dependent methyltransferase